MIHITKATDIAQPHKIMTTPTVLRRFLDDGSNANAVTLPHAQYYLVCDDANLLGMFFFTSFTSCVACIHVAFLPHAYGKATRIAAKQILTRFLDDNAAIHKIIGIIPECNAHAIKLAQDSGMHLETRIKDSIIRDNRSYDHVIYSYLRR